MYERTWLHGNTGWGAAALLAGAVATGGCNTSRGAAVAPTAGTAAAASATPASGGGVSPANDSDSKQPAGDSVATSAGELRIVPIHHATVLLQWGGKAIYADPTGEGKYEGLPKADVILITHGHYDHLSPSTISSLEKADTTVVAPAAVAPSVKAPKVVVLKNGESKEVAGVGVDAVPMYNLVRGPSAGQLYHEKGQGNGYLLALADKHVYLSGDTECVPEVKALHNIDVAFMCMNLPYTMPPSEAAQCVAAFQPSIVYPYHYRGSNLEEFKAGLSHNPGVDVRIRDWYH